jgi:SPP1 gp7 family putative phage head morphogenesis protein
MKMKSEEYWRKRFDTVEQGANDKSTRSVRTLKKYYANAEKEIDAKIAYWYERLAVNNEITPEEAHKLLTADELAEFHWTLEEYIEYGRKNALDQRYMKDLENASARVHIKKLEALKMETRFQVEKLMSKYQYVLDDLLPKVYEDSYYQSMYEISKGYEIGFNVAKLSEDKVKKVVGTKWAVDGSHYSDRIWTNKTKLINTLDNEMSKLVLTKGDINKTVKNVATTMKTSRSNAERLIYTEEAFLCSQAQNDAFKKLNVDEYMVVVTLDDRTCEKCRPFDHEHYPVRDQQVGVNAPPFHPRCRCTTAPYIPEGKYTEAKRASRDDETGKTVRVVSRDTTYDEWKNKHVVEDAKKADDVSLNDLIKQYVNVVRAKKNKVK